MQRDNILPIVLIRNSKTDGSHLRDLEVFVSSMSGCFAIIKIYPSLAFTITVIYSVFLFSFRTCGIVQITKLAAVRIIGLVERLQLSQQIKESVYCLFQQILSQRTNLFFNRHIDQIILCCFYGVAKVWTQEFCMVSCDNSEHLMSLLVTNPCRFVSFSLLGLKISQTNLTFKEIIHNYRKQPQCKPQVFRSVFVDWSSARRNGVC